MDSLLIKKFMPAKEIGKEKEKPAVSLDTDAKHLDYEKGAHKPMKKKGAVAKGPKIVAQNKLAGKSGKFMPKKDHSKFRDSMFGQRPDRQGSDTDEIQDQEVMQDSGEITTEEIEMSDQMSQMDLTEMTDSTEMPVPEETIMPKHESEIPTAEPSVPEITPLAPPAENLVDISHLPKINREAPPVEAFKPEPIRTQTIAEEIPAVEPEPVVQQIPDPPVIVQPTAAEEPKKQSYNEESAVYSFSAKKQKEKEEQAAKEAELAAQAAEADKTEGKKKGCLPFMIGITGTAILICYYLAVLIIGK
jgi:hypothetical protein